MLMNARALQGFKLQGINGEVGKVAQFLFDDHHWTIRYLVAETGDWLTNRQVLISPYAIISVNVETKHMSLNLTKKQIEDSPLLETNMPVSRQFEESYSGYYGLPYYWVGPFVWGAFPELSRNIGVSGKEDNSGKPLDPNLRSVMDVAGHTIESTNGEVGTAVDFVIDDLAWMIRYIIVETGSWWSGRKVVISPRWISRISWHDRKVFIHLTREAIRESPAYSEELINSREYERRLHSHYNVKTYWDDLQGSKK